MKKLAIFCTLLAVSGMLTTVKAGKACCGALKASAKKVEVAAGDKSCSVDCFSTLTLTDEQQKKIKELSAECISSGESIGAELMKKGITEILTPDQLTALKASCSTKGCSLSDIEG